MGNGEGWWQKFLWYLECGQAKSRLPQRSAVASPKKESERFLQHGGSAERCDENGMFRFGVEVEGKQLWAMEKGGSGNSHCLMNAVS